MLFTLFLGIVTFTMLFAWMMMHRQRALALQDAVDSHGLDLAIKQRQQEAEVR